MHIETPESLQQFISSGDPAEGVLFSELELAGQDEDVAEVVTQRERRAVLGAVRALGELDRVAAVGARRISPRRSNATSRR